jgi:hypothetical protein
MEIMQLCDFCNFLFILFTSQLCFCYIGFHSTEKMISRVSCISKPSMLMLWFGPTDWKHVEDELRTQLGDNFLIHGSILSSGHTIYSSSTGSNGIISDLMFIS